jgi:hypothetical protein
MKPKEVLPPDETYRKNLKGLRLNGLLRSNTKVTLRWGDDTASTDVDSDRFRPVSIKKSAEDGSLRFTWVDFADLSMEESFFDNAVQQLSGSPITADRFVSGTKFLHLVSGTSRQNEPNGMIFHLTRTGSTLVHHLLNCCQSVHGLSEPTIFEQAIFVSRDWNAEERSRLLRDIMACYTLNRKSDRHHFVLKLGNALDAEPLQSAFPRVPWIFIYRDPSEIIVSLLNKASGFLEKWRASRSDASILLGLPHLNDPDMSTEEFLARVLGHMCESVLKAADSSSDGQCLAIPYSRLPHATWESIAPHFGIPLSNQDKLIMRSRSIISAKDRSDVIFKQDFLMKRDQITDIISKAVAKYADPLVEMVRHMPQG